MTFNTMAEIVDFQEARILKRERCKVCKNPVSRKEQVCMDGRWLCSTCAKRELAKRRNVIIFPRAFSANSPFGGAA